MRIEIVVQDELAGRVAQQAAEMGITPAKFFTRAAERYLEQLDDQTLASQIDSAIATLDGEDQSAAAAVAAGRARLANTDWDCGLPL